MPIFKRTVTEKRRAANRAAAARSTGPRTAEGKQRSAFNSFKHGLYATQDGIIRQAFARAGCDPAQYDQLHQQLAESLAPQDAIQALLVEDLTRLYWLKNLSQRALAEWQARQAELYRLNCDTRRLDSQRHEPVLDEHRSKYRGGMWAEKCSDRFEWLYRLLDSLDELARTARWGRRDQRDQEDLIEGSETPETEPNTLLERIYSATFTRTGKRIRELFKECAHDGVPAGDPRIAQLRDLIRQERASVEEEERLYRITREREITNPFSESDPLMQPTSQFWQDMTDHEAGFDRQIAAKLRLLMKLQSEASKRFVDDEETSDDPPTERPENGSGPDPDHSGSPSSSGDAAATSSSMPEQQSASVQETESAPARMPETQVKNAGTNPKSSVTGSEASAAPQPEGKQAEARNPETSSPLAVNDPGGDRQ
jgi:hypothetical protein